MNQDRRCTPKIPAANFARPGKQMRFSARTLPSSSAAAAQKWRETRLNATTKRIQTKRSFSLTLMAIPRDHWRPRQVRRGLPGRKQTLRLLDRRLRRLGLRRFVADQPHFAEQFRHLHTGKRFEKRGHLRGNLG